jgi:hypothetical protein
MSTQRWMAAVLACLSMPGCTSGSARMSPSFVAVHNTMAAMGFAQSGEISEGSLGEGGVAQHTARLAAGCYTIVAFGGDGVGDIDVVVKDETGTELASDLTQQSQAAAQFCPDADGEYQLEVRMARGGGSYLVTSWTGAPGGGGGVAVARRPGGGRGSCASPIPLVAGTPVRGNTNQGSDQMTGSCLGDGAAPEVVYALTVERRSQVRVVINSGYDGALYMLGTCGNMQTEIACNDDNPTTSRSQIEAALDPGTYFIAVDGFGTESGEYELTATVSEMASLSQVCGQAPTIQAGNAITGSTANQPSYFTATCAQGARSPDRVYALDVAARSRLRVRMQSNYDGAIYVRRECQNPNTELACNDDHRDPQHAQLVTTLEAGRHYIFADGFGTDNAGDFSLRADIAPLTGSNPPGDACNAPGQIAPGQDVELDSFAAGDQLAGSCGGQGAPDYVYQFTLQNRARVRARVVESEFAPALYIQRTCGQSSTEVVCSSAGAGGGQVELDSTMLPGTYFLVVDGTTPDTFGSARVELVVEDIAALERACQSAPRLRPGATVTGDTASSSDRFRATCAGGAASNDLVYRLVLTRRSRVRITSEQQYDGAIYIRRDCTDQSTEVVCNDDDPDNRHSLVESELDAGTYFVFVDGFANSSQGSFRMDVQVTPLTGGGGRGTAPQPPTASLPSRRRPGNAPDLSNPWPR